MMRNKLLGHFPFISPSAIKYIVCCLLFMCPTVQLQQGNPDHIVEAEYPLAALAVVDTKNNGSEEMKPMATSSGPSNNSSFPLNNQEKTLEELKIQLHQLRERVARQKREIALLEARRREQQDLIRLLAEKYGRIEFKIEDAKSRKNRLEAKIFKKSLKTRKSIIVRLPVWKFKS